MKFRLMVSLVALIALSFIAQDVLAQDLDPSRRKSPIGVSRTDVGNAYVKVTYGRPYVRGREIFGAEGSEALIKYGSVWRLGANESTELTVTEDVMFGGERLAAGTYTLFAMLGADAWTIHVSPQLGLWATGKYDLATRTFTPDVYDPEQDVMRATAAVATLEEPMRQFTIDFEDVDGGVHMVMAWADAEARVPIMPVQ
ncbi:MAG: DUF2911 domain-containing protein [Bacteroidota bacterium]